MRAILISIIFLYSLHFLFPGEPFKDQQTSIHYTVYGEGPPLLIINGGPGFNSEGFKPLAIALSKNYKTILYDQRGTGKSYLKNVNSKTITLDAMVGDMEKLRKKLGVDKWIIMGHSFGGMLGYYYASKHPENIVAMIQSSSGGMDLTLLNNLDIRSGLSQLERDSLQFYTEKIDNGDISFSTRYKRATFLAPAYVYNREYIPVVAERLTQGNMEINNLVWQDLRAMNFNVINQMKKFDKPVLIIHGEDDVVDISIPKKADEILPNSELFFLPKTKHYGWLDQKERFYQTIFKFLERQDLNL
ncbi:alpha/beta hydrolase [Gramella sp. AN32]|uniref:Alpha/beta fold hydrolase n=1 Tax=Christiangramia antarctica TaxID=2058158 RepID=A0ABW5X927_9FLAO|nr:alpha/beta hydrolase [Gramella sp. AN32]MCM4154831.1 alpha/beta hydrolase [Gramella sp. AN32]